MGTNDTEQKTAELIEVVSGGQTGVDRAALDAALAAGLLIGGWCPRGRRAEDGRISADYPLKETASRNYAVRTEWNVRDSDGTLVLVLDEISSGTRLTIEQAEAQRKPLQVIHLLPDPANTLLTDDDSSSERVRQVVQWLGRHRIRTLNVAGPRGSSDQRVYSAAREFLDILFRSAFT